MACGRHFEFRKFLNNTLLQIITKNPKQEKFRNRQ